MGETPPPPFRFFSGKKKWFSDKEISDWARPPPISDFFRKKTVSFIDAFPIHRGRCSRCCRDKKSQFSIFYSIICTFQTCHCLRLFHIKSSFSFFRPPFFLFCVESKHSFEFSPSCCRPQSSVSFVSVLAAGLLIVRHQLLYPPLPPSFHSAEVRKGTRPAKVDIYAARGLI